MTTMDEEHQGEGTSTEYCSNCKKDIPSVNYVMHTSHCSRNIMLCKQCNEAVPISEKDEHFEEYHAKVKCECGESFEKMDLETHKERDCTHRKVVCEYCELELPFSEMKSHKDFCGSRTQLCEKCNKYVLHKDLEDHLNNDCQAELPTRKNNAAASSMHPVGHNKIPLDDYIHNVDYGDGYEVTALQRLLQAQEGRFGDGDVSVHGTFYDIRNMFPQTTRDVVARGLNSQPSRSRRNRLSGDFDYSIYEDEIPSGNQLEGDELMAALLSCEDDNSGRGPNSQPNRSRRNRLSGDFDNLINEVEIPRRNQLEGDELMAALLACQNDNTEFDHQSFSSEKDLFQRQNSFENDIESRNDDHEPALDQTVLPCEFCGEAIQAQELILHQTGCQLTTIGASNTPSSGGYPNLRSQPRSLPPLQREPFNDEFERDNQTDNYDETLLPCEFCDDLFNPEILFAHQSMCDPQRTRPSSVLQTEHFYESLPEPTMPNNARPRVSNIPPRPSRPVVNRRLEDNTNDGLLNKEPTNSSASVRNDTGSHIGRSDKSEQRRQSPWQRNDNRETNDMDAYSNDSPLTVIKRNSSKNLKKEGHRNSFPELGFEDNKDKYEVDLPRKSSSGSREKLSGFTGPGRSKAHIGVKVSNSKTASYGSKSDSKRDLGQPLQELDFSEYRPLKREPLDTRSDKNKTTTSKTSSTKKKGSSSSAKKSELAPCFNVKPLSSTDTRRQDRQPSQPRMERSVKNGTSERGGVAASNENRDTQNTESRTRRSKKKYA